MFKSNFTCEKTYKHVFCNSITVNKITIEIISLQHITNIVEKHKNMFFSTKLYLDMTRNHNVSIKLKHIIIQLKTYFYVFFIWMMANLCRLGRQERQILELQYQNRQLQGEKIKLSDTINKVTILWEGCAIQYWLQKNMFICVLHLWIHKTLH